MIYLLVFLLSAFLIYKASERNDSRCSTLLISGLLLPCILAGIRSNEVGTDVATYAVWTYEGALGTNLLTFLESYAGISPVGFNLTTWITANLFRSFAVYLGLLQFLTIFPIYLGSHFFFRKREWVSLLCYFLLIYPISLNIMKQCIAVSIIFAAYIFVYRRKPAYFILFTLLACSFHQTALIGLMIYPLHCLTVNWKKGRIIISRYGIQIVLVMTILFIAGVLLVGNQIISLFSYLKESYSYQVLHIGKGGPNESVAVIAAISLSAWWVCRKRACALKRDISAQQDNIQVHISQAAYDYFFLLFYIACVLMQLDLLSPSVGRIGYYFLPFSGLFVSSLYFEGDQFTRKTAVGLLFLFMAYFIFAFIVKGGGEVYPFEIFNGMVLP